MLASPALRTPRTCPSSTRRDPLSHSPSPRARRPANVHAHRHTYTRTRFTFPFCFPFPSSSFLLVTLQHLSPILVPLSSFVVNESLYLPFFLPFFLCPSAGFFLSFSLLPGNPRTSLRPTLPRGCYRCYFFLYRIYHFPLGLKEYLLLAPSVPHSPRNSRPLRRQPNKCLSDYLHRHFSATLS